MRTRDVARLVVVLAAVALVAVGPALRSACARFVLDKGFIGLPPVGATPSSPASGELEIFYWVMWLTTIETRSPGLGVRRRAAHSAWGTTTVPASANPLSTGFLEQRLTPEGVERLRSEIAAAGDFGSPDELAPPGKPPCPEGVSPSAQGNCQPPTPEPAPDAPITVPFHTPIDVAGLGTLVHVDHARDLTRLRARLSDPGSWLPASAWAEQRHQGVRGLEVPRLLQRLAAG